MVFKPVLHGGFLLVTAAGMLSGCLFQELAANQRALERQRVELDRQQRELNAILSQQQYSNTPAAPGACDHDVIDVATHRGDAKFAAGNFKLALGYYSDAVKACPDSAEAEFNLARAYEALNQREPARAHYQRAAQNAAGSNQQVAQQAQDALARIGALK